MVHPDDRETVEAQSQAFIDGVGGDLADYRMVRPDGRIVWVRDRAYAHRDDDGRVLWEHGILFDVTELKEAEARIAHMAFHDGLTGLANRQLFEETLALAVERAKRDGTVVAVLYLDLDNFKLVNDSLGHHAGDRLLIQLADRLSACTRDTDLVARQGGDEFLMLLADLGHADYVEAIRAVTDRVYEAMAAPFDLEGTEFFARGSIGISVYPRDAHDAETLLRNADIAMYRAKRLDPGGHAFFAADADDAQDRLSFATRLRQAVEDESWVLHYQPVVDLADRRIVGAEALIRWEDVAAGIVPPGEFIPVAEELGLIEAIGDWVVDEVARQQREWSDAGLHLEVSFNLSPRQLWTPRLAERLIGKLHDAGVDPSCMQAEITETSAMADPERTQRILRELHAWGLRLALDDFGTGYSSLARLKHMPVDVLKIDREFVRARRQGRPAGGDGASDDPGGAEPGHGAARRRRRDRGRVHLPAVERLPPGAGLLVRPPDGGPRVRAAGHLGRTPRPVHDLTLMTRCGGGLGRWRRTDHPRSVITCPAPPSSSRSPAGNPQTPSSILTGSSWAAPSSVRCSEGTSTPPASPTCSPWAAGTTGSPTPRSNGWKGPSRDDRARS